MDILQRVDSHAESLGVNLLLIGSEESGEREKYAPAIVGVTDFDGHWSTSEDNDRVAVVYDEAKMIEIIAEDMEPMGDPDNQYNDVYFIAREHFEFNIKGSWVGEHTPIFVETMNED